MRRSSLAPLALLALLLARPSRAETPPLPPSQPAADDSDALWNEGFVALGQNDLAGAQVAFEHVALHAADPQRRTQAHLLAEHLRTLLGRPPAPPAQALDQSGRAGLVLTTSALGLAWGAAVIDTFALHDRPAVGAYLLTAAGAFTLPFFLTRQVPVSWGQTDLVIWGGTRGAAAGFLTAALLTGDVHDRGLAGAMLAGSLVGAAGTFSWAGAARMTPGVAHTVGLGGDLGLLWGAGWSAIITSPSCAAESSGGEARCRKQWQRSMGALGLVGMAGGLLGGEFLASHRDNSWGDAEVMTAATWLGGWSGATVSSLFAGGGNDAVRRDRAIALTILGATGGAVGGDFLVRHTHFTVAQSLLIDVGLLAGGAAAAGLTYLVASPSGVAPYMVAGTLGGALGLGLTYWAFGNGRSSESSLLRLHRALATAGLPTHARLVPWLTTGSNAARGAAVAGQF